MNNLIVTIILDNGNIYSFPLSNVKSINLYESNVYPSSYNEIDFLKQSLYEKPAKDTNDLPTYEEANIKTP